MTVTNADLERRLAEVEATVGILEERIASYGREQDARFKALEHGMAAVMAKLDTVLMSNEQARGDPTNSPAGRALIMRLDTIQSQIDRIVARPSVWWSWVVSAVALLASSVLVLDRMGLLR